MGTKKHLSGFLAVFMFFLSCDSEDDEVSTDDNLANLIRGQEVVEGNVIACAASNLDSSVVSIFLYPRSGVTNIRFFETSSIAVNENDFAQYREGEAPLINVFNGYLLKFEILPEVEKWVIVSFEEEGKIHLSNPIRLKQATKPTEYLPEKVDVASEGTMPLFIWEDGMYNDTVIYFQVVSNTDGSLLSGTYTLDQMFQYYKLDNVVLNITRETPPDLEEGQRYNFTLLTVSEDNWVNLFSEISFELP